MEKTNEKKPCLWIKLLAVAAILAIIIGVLLVLPPPPPIYANITITIEGQGSTVPPVGNYPDTWIVMENLYVTSYSSPGWLYDHMKRNGVEWTRNNPGEFLNLDENEFIEVAFVELPPPTYANVTIAITGQGSTEPPAGNHPKTWLTGDELWITANPAEGWLYDHMKRNGVEWTRNNPGELLNLGESELIEVVFVKEEEPPL